MLSLASVRINGAYVRGLKKRGKEA